VLAVSAVTESLRALEPEFERAEGTVSVWCGGLSGVPDYARLATTSHLAASTIKVALLVAAYRQADAGVLNLDTEVAVHDDFASVVSGRFVMDHGYDNDDEPWDRLGQTASLRWLARRMIVRSSNLATDLVLEHVGYDAVAAAVAECGAVGTDLRKPICDDVASERGIVNTATAAGLAALFGALANATAASPRACAEMLDLLRAQEYLEGIAAGLPAGTGVASKGGWIDEARHDAALIEPADAAPYLLVVCTSGLADDASLTIIRDLAAASWAAR